MSKQVEHAPAPAVVRVIELVGISNRSWSDAAQQAVTRAAQTIRHITGVDVIHSSAVVQDGRITEYHVNVKVAFVVEAKESDDENEDDLELARMFSDEETIDPSASD